MMVCMVCTGMRLTLLICIPIFNANSDKTVTNVNSGMRYTGRRYHLRFGYPGMRGMNWYVPHIFDLHTVI